jgi:hypothetical protein
MDDVEDILKEIKRLKKFDDINATSIDNLIKVF